MTHKKGNALSKATNKPKPIPVKIVHDEPSPVKSSPENDRWRAEDALRDIERARKHETDKGLMKQVKALAKEKMNCLKKI